MQSLFLIFFCWFLLVIVGFCWLFLLTSHDRNVKKRNINKILSENKTIASINMEPTSDDVIDLRADKSKPGRTLPAKTSLYTISDHLELGKSSPFFLDKGKAILFGFFQGNVDQSLMPVTNQNLNPGDIGAIGAMGSEGGSLSNLFGIIRSDSKDRGRSELILNQPIRSRPGLLTQNLPTPDMSSINELLGLTSIKPFAQPAMRELEVQQIATQASAWGLKLASPTQSTTSAAAEVKQPQVSRPNVYETPGAKATNFNFPGKNKVLLEITSDKTILFDAEIAVDDVILLLRFCPDSRYSSKLSANIAVYHPQINIVDLDNIKPWVDTLPSGELNPNGTFRLLIDRRVRLSVLDNSDTDMSKYIHTVSTEAHIVCRPQILFPKRTIYPVNWEKVWLSYIQLKMKGISFDNLKTAFSAAARLLIGQAVDTSESYFPTPVLLNIISNLTETRDVIALCSTSARFKNLCYSSLAQRLLRQKYQPGINQFFDDKNENAGNNGKPLPHDVRVNYPGLPIVTEITRKLWPVGFIFFRDDFNVVTEEKTPGGMSMDERQIRNLPTENDRQKAIAARQERQRVALANAAGVHVAGVPLSTSVGLLPQDVPAEAKTNISDSSINNIIRNTSSFISMFAMITSLMIRTRAKVNVIMRLHFTYRDYEKDRFSSRMTVLEVPFTKRNDVDVVQKYPGSQHFEGDLTAESILAPTWTTERVLTEDTVQLYNMESVGLSGSWLHDVPVLPFFQNANYAASLERVKQIEIERYKLLKEVRDEMESGVTKRRGTGLGILMTKLSRLSTLVINRLTLSRFGQPLLFIEIVTRGHIDLETLFYQYNLKPPDRAKEEFLRLFVPEAITVLFRTDGLDQSTLSLLRLHDLFKSFIPEDQELQERFVYGNVDSEFYKYLVDDFNASALLSGPSDKIILPTYHIRTRTHGNLLSHYYSTYMFLTSLIRLFVLREMCDSSDWTLM